MLIWGRKYSIENGKLKVCTYIFFENCNFLFKDRASQWRKASLKQRRSQSLKPEDIDTIQEVSDKNDSLPLDDETDESNHMPVTRTNTFQDPESLDEREV